MTILQCPITGATLGCAETNELEQIRADISGRVLTHLDGSPVAEIFDDFLQTPDARIRYPVRNRILILLSDFAILKEADRRQYAGYLTEASTLSVMKFYDEVGWRKTDLNSYYDADINEDFREVSRCYIRDCHLRVNDYLPSFGEYLLDIASGPVQYHEYLTYSDRFKKRICCDVSFEALQAAATRLGEKGIYIQADITNIPLKSASVDAFVSLHTIYHVPPNKQLAAFHELERVTRAGGGGVVVYSWGNNSWGNRLATPYRSLAALANRTYTAIRRLVPERMVAMLKRWRGRPPLARGSHKRCAGAASQHCFHAHSYVWFVRNLAASKRWHLCTWRSVGLTMLKQRVPDNASGRAFLRVAFWLESLFPAILGRIGQYPMFVFQKARPDV